MNFSYSRRSSSCSSSPAGASPSWVVETQQDPAALREKDKGSREATHSKKTSPTPPHYPASLPNHRSFGHEQECPCHQGPLLRLSLQFKKERGRGEGCMCERGGGSETQETWKHSGTYTQERIHSLTPTSTDTTTEDEIHSKTHTMEQPHTQNVTDIFS